MRFHRLLLDERFFQSPTKCRVHPVAVGEQGSHADVPRTRTFERVSLGHGLDLGDPLRIISAYLEAKI